MKARIKVIIVDDHPLVLEGLRKLVEGDSRYQIVAEARDGETAVHLIETHRPDIAVIDIHLPKLGGLEVIRQLRKRRYKTRFVVLTMTDNESVFNKAMELGVMGYVLKQDAPSDILRSFEALLDGKPFVSSAISGLLLRRNQRPQASPNPASSFATLTPMELRVLKLVAQHKTTKMIASELFVSPHTVETHRGNICSKLQLRGSHPLLRFALEHQADLQATVQ
jgi:DNA-binding NarL/FixJ family response regulator